MNPGDLEWLILRFAKNGMWLLLLVGIGAGIVCGHWVGAVFATMSTGCLGTALWLIEKETKPDEQ